MNKQAPADLADDVQAHHEVYIAAIGGSVRVRPIPPALARQLEDRATKAGKLDLAELRMLKFFHGVAEPNFTMAEVRAIFAKHGPSVWLILDRIDEISGTEQIAVDGHLAYLHRQAIRGAWTAACASERRGEQKGQRRAREQRGSHPGRPRGSRRATAAGSSSSRDDPDPDPEPAARRLCAYCGDLISADRSPSAKYCTDQHADRDRQRRKRDRDRISRPVERLTAADLRMRKFEPGELERLRLFLVCRCNGHHLELEPGRCSKCGRWLPHQIAGGQELYEEFFARGLHKAPRQRHAA